MGIYRSSVLYLYTAKDDYEGGNALNINVSFFDPTWACSGYTHCSEYNQEDYIDHIRNIYNNPKYRKAWLGFFQRDCLVITCKCESTQPCLRYILADLFVKVGKFHGLPVNYLGELI